MTNEKNDVHQIICQINDMICTSFGVQTDVQVFNINYKYIIQGTRRIELLQETNQTLTLTQKIRDDKYQLEDHLIELRSQLVQLELEKNHMEYEVGDAMKQKADVEAEHEKQVAELRKLVTQDQANIQQINQLKKKISQIQYEWDQQVMDLENTVKEKKISVDSMMVKLDMYEQDFANVQGKVEREYKAKHEMVVVMLQQQSEEQMKNVQVSFKARIK